MNYDFTDSDASKPRRKARKGAGGASSELRRARTLDDSQIERVLDYFARTSNSPHSDKIKFLLSVYAGLRAAEIAGLTLDAVVDADDTITRRIIVGRHIAKCGRERIIPMHPRIRSALAEFRQAHPDIRFFAFSARGRIRRQTAATVTAWFGRIYQEVGLKGCSSHSGRRTFLTRMARMANLYGHSLRDVQLLAGHARLESTAAYIDAAEDLTSLVEAMGAPTHPSHAETGDRA